jgi:hypothetical protein
MQWLCRWWGQYGRHSSYTHAELGTDRPTQHGVTTYVVTLILRSPYDVVYSRADCITMEGVGIVVSSFSMVMLCENEERVQMQQVMQEEHQQTNSCNIMPYHCFVAVNHRAHQQVVGFELERPLVVGNLATARHARADDCFPSCDPRKIVDEFVLELALVQIRSEARIVEDLPASLHSQLAQRGHVREMVAKHEHIAAYL